MKSILIVGAGRLGKGFIGETFDNAGWKISFLDKNEEVVENLKQSKAYHVTVHREDRIDQHEVKGFEVFSCSTDYPCMEAVLSADVIALVIYPEDFADAANYLGPCLAKRALLNPTKDLDILCLTNKNYLMPGIETCFLNALGTDTAKAWFKEHVALRDTIIRRGTDAQSNAALQVRTTAVLSLLIQSPLLVSLDDVEWMEPCDNLELLKDIKVFIVNGPHVTAAFAGYLKGYRTINEVRADPECAALIKAVHGEAYEGILREYPITKADLDRLSVFPVAKGEMEDQIYRVAYDPIRKLGRNDRLTGMALICLKNDIDPVAIIQSIANGFAYTNPQDSMAVKLQKEIKEQGIRYCIMKYCGLEKNHSLVSRIETCYDKIINDLQIQPKQ